MPEERAATSPAVGETQANTEETARVANWIANLWRNVFVQPKLSMRPGFDEIHPDWIPEEDTKFVWKWIRGEVDNLGESLSSFSASGQGGPGVA